ncbi:unnamed protein product, partial [marine sediment metagenome]
VKSGIVNATANMYVGDDLFVTDDGTFAGTVGVGGASPSVNYGINIDLDNPIVRGVNVISAAVPTNFNHYGFYSG